MAAWYINLDNLLDRWVYISFFHMCVVRLRMNKKAVRNQSIRYTGLRLYKKSQLKGGYVSYGSTSIGFYSILLLKGRLALSPRSQKVFIDLLVIQSH